MNTTAFRSVLPTALAATLLLAGCSKEEAAPVPPIEEAPVVEEPAPVTPVAVAAAASIAGIDLGKSLGPDDRVVEPTAIFAPGDKVYVTVTTMTSEATTPVAGKLTVQWKDPAGRPIGEPMTKDFNYAGPGVTSFLLESTPSWLPGTYKVEVMLDADRENLTTREFAVVR